MRNTFATGWLRKRIAWSRSLSSSPRRAVSQPRRDSPVPFLRRVLNPTDRLDRRVPPPVSADIVIDASSLTIRLENEDTPLELPIPWLWLNDPTHHIQLTSGQKLETPLSYFSSGARIVHANVVTTSTAEHNNTPTMLRMLLPPVGSLHPLGGLWQSNAAATLEQESVPTGRKLLRVIWETNESTFDSFYSLDWLLEQRSKDKTRTNQPQSDSNNILGVNSRLSTVEYSQLTANDSSAAQYDLLHAIFRDGAAIVRGTPNIDASTDDALSPVATVGKLLSANHLSHGYLYGDVFHVETVPDAINIAYTSVALPPHQDLSYYESPPGLQLLHCAQNTNVTGGGSTLVDALAAAEAFKSIAPDLFQTLTTTNATFIKQRQGADMNYHRPHIRLDASGQHVVSVHWSPPFEGPLARDIGPHDAMRYYIAHAAFQRMLDNSLPTDQYLLSNVLSKPMEDALMQYANEHTWEHQLQDGEMLVFNNQRMLHGRRSFSMQCANTSRRHLMGCYTNMDESLSEYRILRREQGQVPVIRAGNGSV